jgi:hypothetical protein
MAVGVTGRFAGRERQRPGVGRMFRSRFSHWLIGVGLLAAVEGVTGIALALSFAAPAQAQITDQRYPFLRRQHPRSGGSSFFQDLFGGFGRSPERSGQLPQQNQPQQHVDYSRAPSPRKPDPNAPPPTTTIVVMGDGMADWLAYGLEDAFADSPEVAIVRQNKPRSGLIRYEYRSDLDWWHVARDDLAQEKANYVVMMLGISDRQNISEKDVAKEAEKDQQAKDQKAKDQKAQNPTAPAPNQDQADNPDQSLIAAPEPKYPHGVIPFRSDRWAQVYSRRIDLTVAALKSKGVPVFWVGLPSIRGTRSTADAVYLNDLYRARAERAGAVYIDVWDGFVDEAGKYSNYGPDYEGQTRRLRSLDGVFFTKYGARKLAHYVEHEIRRYMNNRAVVSLPTGPIAPLPGAGKSKARPLAGPVVPLTVTPANVGVLAGGPGMRSSTGDAIATKVLVKGDAVSAPSGRADDFAWPASGDANKPAQQAATPPAAMANVAPTATAPARIIKPAPPVAAKPAPPAAPPAQAKKPTEPKREPVAVKKPAEPRREPVAVKKPAEQTAQTRTEEPKLLPPEPIRPRPAHQPARRRSDDSLFGPGGPFGWLR